MAKSNKKIKKGPSGKLDAQGDKTQKTSSQSRQAHSRDQGCEAPRAKEIGEADRGLGGRDRDRGHSRDVDLESVAGRMQRAAVQKVGEVAARATRAMKSAVASSPQIPSYDELPVREGAPAGAAWGVFGDDDEVGTINLLTPDRVIAATSLDSIGQSVRTQSADQHSRPAAVHARQAFAHRQDFPDARNSCSTTISTTSIRKRRRNGTRSRTSSIRIHGAYNGIPDNEITGRGGTRLGIDNLARRGIAGRGVLADVARYYERVGKSINFDQGRIDSARRCESDARRRRRRAARRRHPADSHRMDEVLPVGERRA